ncbi:hypothetical protein PRIPAC_79505 [Pristionchus pacificus]|uniref:G protein-coupled receptor n=1 Tax=Pristionchus pacificus TaxID=54126 RepID=A0A2A6CQ15_PRIPA|nr:hypothetical protein PRIPAC_79505 [Pristionchus pacificus]|eukprot:PDM80305.1 G protein-coupled receptor [Pristionchus pacificus]
MHNGHGLTIPAIPNRGIRSLRLQNNISSTYHTLVQICASFDEISITIRMNSKKEPAISLSEIVVNAHLAGGVCANLLLLYAIARFSRPSMGTYKYLLATFASVDVILSVLHAVTRPMVVIADGLLGVITDSFIQDKWMPTVYCSSFTIPFSLMNIHFLYRFWAIRYPHLIGYFSDKRFIALLASFPISGFIAWSVICLVVMSGKEHDPDGAARLTVEYYLRYGKVIPDGWIFVNSREGNPLRVYALIQNASFNVIMFSCLTLAISLASLTYYHLKHASLIANLSPTVLAMHNTMLFAVCIQTLIPLCFVYLPYLGVVNLSFFHLPTFSVDMACLPLTACFPMWDALIIIFLIRDYREGLLSILPKGKKSDKAFEVPITLFQHVSGVVLLVINSFVLLLILSDDDTRNRHYRKYMGCLQLSAMASDTLSDFYAPIMIFQKGIFYSDSLLSNILPFWTFFEIVFYLSAETVIIFLACVYYRRGVSVLAIIRTHSYSKIVLHQSRFINYYGWRRVLFFAFLQLYMVIAVSAILYFLDASIRSSEVGRMFKITPYRIQNFLPPDLYWAKNKTSYMFVRMDANVIYSNFVIYPATLVPFIGIMWMLAQLMSEVKKGMKGASVATLRYQRLAVRSLVVQAVVPNLVYVDPLIAISFLQFASVFIETGETFEKFGELRAYKSKAKPSISAMILSPCLFIIMTKHSFANSMTILFCSPSFRKKRVALITRSPVTVIHFEKTRDRISTILMRHSKRRLHYFNILVSSTAYDTRNRHYRKYLGCLQISSMASDTFSDFYAPIMQIHKGLFYSDSMLSKVLSIWTFFVRIMYEIKLYLFAETVIIFLACVYYRRGKVLHPNRSFNYYGRRRIVLYVFLHVYTLVAVSIIRYSLDISIKSSESFLPLELRWVKNKTSFMFIQPNANAFYANCVIYPAALTLFFGGLSMLVQLMSEVKKGIHGASVATQRDTLTLMWYNRYQRLALRSLVMQGVVPTLLYVIPLFGTSFLHFVTEHVQTGETFDKFAMVLSPSLFIIMTKHSFANSMTILLCSPSFRKKSIALITRSNAPSLRLFPVLLIMSLTVVITGANRGIGLGLVGEILKNDEVGKVFATTRSFAKSADLAMISDPRLTIVAEIVGTSGVDILVNNAGVLIGVDYNNPIKREDVAVHFNVNCIATMVVTQAFRDLLKLAAKKNEHAQVVNISSDLGSIADSHGSTPRGFTPYSMSKAALNMFTRNVSIDWKDDGIRCTSIHPGWVQTDMGGQEAELTVEESTSNIARTIFKLDESTNGLFYNWKFDAMKW